MTVTQESPRLAVRPSTEDATRDATALRGVVFGLLLAVPLWLLIAAMVWLLR